MSYFFLSIRKKHNIFELPRDLISYLLPLHCRNYSLSSWARRDKIKSECIDPQGGIYMLGKQGEAENEIFEYNK